MKPNKLHSVLILAFRLSSLVRPVVGHGKNLNCINPAWVLPHHVLESLPRATNYGCRLNLQNVSLKNTKHTQPRKIPLLRSQRRSSLWATERQVVAPNPSSHFNGERKASKQMGKAATGILERGVVHRLLASGVYIIPLLDMLQSFMTPLASRYPSLIPIARILHPIVTLYTSIPYLSQAVSSGIYYAFIKGPYKFPYYVKFNAIQALVLTTFQYALSMVYYRVFAPHAIGASPYHDIALLTCALTCTAAITKSAIEGAAGRVGNLPIISEAVRLQVRDDDISE